MTLFCCASQPGLPASSSAVVLLLQQHAVGSSCAAAARTSRCRVTTTSGEADANCSPRRQASQGQPCLASSSPRRRRPSLQYGNKRIARHPHHPLHARTAAHHPTAPAAPARNARSFSTSIHARAPAAAVASLDSSHPPAPVTLATLARSPQGPPSWWHRAFSFSAVAETAATHADVNEQGVSSQSTPSSSPSSSSSSSSSESHPTPPPTPPSPPPPPNDIVALMNHPDIFENIRPPRHPIVLCHGLYGFDVRGPFFGLEIHYWAVVLDILRKKIGADVIVRGVPGTGSIAQRAQVLHDFLRSEEAGVRGQKLNFIGHSMGGLDARYLISHLKPSPDEYTPVSLTTLSTPHKGSPFMDWCNANVGIGREYVEEAIREYRRAQEEAEAAANPDDAEVVEKLPYSLKTPLFVRPKKSGGEANPNVNRDAAASATSSPPNTTASPSATPSSSGDTIDEVKSAIAEKLARDDAKEVESKSSDSDGKQSAASPSPPSSSSSLSSLTSLGFVTPLTRALSSLTGHFSSYMLSVLDTPAYAMLSTRYMSKVFNPSTPDSPDVQYFSIAARTRKIPLWHPLWLPKVILDAAAESRTVGAERDGSAAALGNPETQGNDGLVAVQSAKWGTFLGVIEQKDHWDLRGSGAPRWGLGGKLNPATGKPWATTKNGVDKKAQEDAEQIARAAQGHGVKRKESEEGWLKINRLLGALIGRSGGGKGAAEEAKSQDEAAAVTAQQSPPPTPLDTESAIAAVADAAKELVGSDGEAAEGAKTEEANREKNADDRGAARRDDDASASASASSSSSSAPAQLVDEVAEWISDRLPQSSPERRKLADQAAQQQEADVRDAVSAQRSASDLVAQHFQPTWAGSDVYADAAATTAEQDTSASAAASTPPVSLGSSPTVNATAAALSNDAIPSTATATATTTTTTLATQSSLSASTPPSPATSAIPSSPSSPSSSSPASSSPPRDKEREELERFWIALCQHLHSQGF